MQNMIVSSDSIGVLPPIMFLLYMFVPTCIAWVITTTWIQYCWLKKNTASAETMAKGTREDGDFSLVPISAPSTGSALKLKKYHSEKLSMDSTGGNNEIINPISNTVFLSSRGNSSADRRSVKFDATEGARVVVKKELQELSQKHGAAVDVTSLKASASGGNAAKYTDTDLKTNAETEAATELEPHIDSDTAVGVLSLTITSPVSRRERDAGRSRDEGSQHVISAPIPYSILGITLTMIILIFFQIMSISGLVCVTALVSSQ